MCRRRRERGTEIKAISSPFGLIAPSILQNSITTGVITNYVLENAAPNSLSDCVLYLIDARCYPGSEGGGVFDKNDYLVSKIDFV